MLDIRIKTQLKKWMRFNDCCDWFKRRGIDEFRIMTSQPDYEFLLTIHELTEWYLCKRDGISQKQVDDWDRNSEKKGDDKNAPYHIEHKTAEKLEKYAAKLLHVDWKKYEESL